MRREPAPGGVSRWLWGRDGAPWLEAGSTLWTRGQARHELRRQAKRLRRLGLRPGQRVGWLPAAQPEELVAALAVLEAAGELVLLPLRETPARRAEEEGRLALWGRLQSGDYEPGPRAATAPAGCPARVWLRSSGSLGRPRWLRHGLDGLLAGARAAAARLELDPGQGWLLSLPLDHVGGLGILLRGLVSGCRLRCPDAGGVPGALAAGGLDWLSLVPTQLEDLVAAEVSAAGLRGVLLGGAPLPAGVRRRALAAGWPLWTSYGATETGALVCAERQDPARPASSGAPFAPHQLRLTTAGRVEVESPALCEAELDDADQPRERPAGPWLSGDLGRWERGALCLLGRADRVLISGGEKIPAEFVEEALASLPEVRRVAVVALPDARLGERPAAFVDWTGGALPEVAVLAQRLAARLPRHMLPVRIWPWPAELADPLKPPLARLARLARERVAAESGPQAP
ncbi:MAG: AMP-binding protein [Candidatus Delongbacteria bacterium]